MVNALKNAEVDKASDARNRWYQNADSIARFLCSVNPCWATMKWRDLLYSHLQMTEQEATLRLQGNYAADIQVFDDIESGALEMADYMFCGIIRQSL